MRLCRACEIDALFHFLFYFFLWDIAEMARAKTCKVTDEFWEKVEPLIPPPARDPHKKYQRKLGGGRKPISPRRIFEAVIYILRTESSWQALPKELFGSPSALHTHFKKWQRAGFFEKLWDAGLAEHHEMEGIAWVWNINECKPVAAPPALKTAAHVPVDNGKTFKPALVRPWRPAFKVRVTNAKVNDEDGGNGA